MPITLIGIAMIVTPLLSAIRTVIAPRGIPDPLTRIVFVSIRVLFDLRTRRLKTFAERDRVMVLFAPVSLLALPAVWLTLVLLGYSGIYWALGGRTPRQDFTLSGSSLFTLGFVAPRNLPETILSFTEAALGLTLLALLISYLPSIYAAFNRREVQVGLLEVRAGSPPSAVDMLERHQLIVGLDGLVRIWETWEQWFADIEESHTSQASLPFFRSSVPDRHWVTAAGAVLDAASFSASSIDWQRQPEAELCVRAGYVALRSIADFFSIRYDPNPAPSDPIAVTRAEWEAMCDRLAAVGVPLKPDRDQAWKDFAGWRVNYDTVLLALAALTMAPPAPWSSDRSSVYRRPPLLTWRHTKAGRASGG